MKDAKGHGSDARGAHSAGVEQVGRAPVVTYGGNSKANKAGSETTTHYFEVSHPSFGDKPHTVSVEYWPEYRAGNVNAWGSLENINKIGAANVRHIIGRIKSHIPDLDTLKGVRQTGVRKQQTSFRKKLQTIDVRSIKPEK